jgi:broad specificity phosphatase PhoE
VLGRWQGQSDPALSPAGRIQAERLAETLRAAAPTRVIASDLRRAAETARIVGGRMGLPVELEPRLRERALGAWTGLQHHQVAARWPEELKALQARNLRLRPPGGESLLEVRERLADWLHERELSLRATPTLVVTHGGLLRALFPERFANTETRVSSVEELWQTLGVQRPRRKPA